MAEENSKTNWSEYLASIVETGSQIYSKYQDGKPKVICGHCAEEITNPNYATLKCKHTFHVDCVIGLQRCTICWDPPIADDSSSLAGKIKDIAVKNTSYLRPSCDSCKRKLVYDCIKLPCKHLYHISCYNPCRSTKICPTCKKEFEIASVLDVKI